MVPKVSKRLLLALAMAAAGIALIVAAARPRGDEPAPPGTMATVTEFPASLEGASAALREGEPRAAVAILRALHASAAPEAADEIRLALGHALLEAHEVAAAVPVLDEAAAGPLLPRYARLLVVRAVLEGRLASRYGAAMADAARLADETGLPRSVEDEARWRIVQIAHLAKDDAAIARAGATYLARVPAGAHRDEVLWRTGEAEAALRSFAAAHDRFATLWHELPDSPFARPARQRLLELERAHRLPVWKPSAAERRAFIVRLQRIGLHEEALLEIALYRPQAARAGQPGDALLLEAESRLARRDNDGAVRAASEVRRRWPRSRAAAPAALAAIRALRRAERTAGVRDWVSWLEATFPGRDEVREARYGLGVHLVAAGDVAGGSAMLEQVAETNSVTAQDALWKLAWTVRLQGDVPRAAARLRELLSRFPSSRYRRGALYWTARFTSATDADGAAELWRTVVREFPHDYYGHKAADALAAMGRPAASIGSPERFPAHDPFERASLPPGVSPGAWAEIVALRHAGLFAYAADALRALPQTDRTPDLQFALADLHAAAGEHDTASHDVERWFGTFARTGSPDPSLVPPSFWHIVFPLHHRGTIERSVAEVADDRHPVDAALVAALIHNESGFSEHAISGAGAIGLMQVTPEAAAAVARAHDLPRPTREELFDPETNIRFGTLEIAARLADFGGEVVPAVASYNAGIAPARAWWDARPPDQPVEEFIETIPYLETRLYVKNVTADVRNYRWAYANTSPAVASSHEPS